MSYTFGWNFRSTAAFAIDAVDETYVYLRGEPSEFTDFFPTVRNGQVFGYDVLDQSNTLSWDDNFFVDRRLAGFHQVNNNGAQSRFVVQLPSPGTYDVHLSAGTSIWSQAALNFDIYDDQAIIWSIYLPSGLPPGTYIDATQSVYAASQWPDSERPLRLQFSSAIFRLRYGLSPSQLTGQDQTATVLNHVRLTQVIVVSTEKTYVGSGLLQLAGPKSAVTLFVPQQSVTRTYLPTGGLHVAGGAATNPFLVALKTYVGSGILRFAAGANTIATKPPPRLPRATTVPWDGQMTTKGLTI